MSIITRLKNTPAHQIYFLFGLAILLAPLLYFQCNLTADGPCHLYNAGLLNQYAGNLNQNFLQQWYEPNFLLFPNWFTHASLSFLLLFFEPLWAEKILQILYVVLFAYYGYRLCRILSPNGEILAILLLPLVYHFHFYKGFYNYSFSVVFAMGFIGYWLKNRDTLTRKKLWRSAAWLVLIYFSHLMGLLLVFVFAAVFGVDGVKKIKADKTKFKDELLTSLSKYFLVFVPVIILFVGYSFSRKSEISYAYKPEFSQLLSDLFNGWVFNCFSGKESVWSVILACLLIILPVLSWFINRRNKSAIYSIVFLMISLLILLFYFISPNSFTGGERIVERFYYLFFLTLVLLANCFPVKKIMLHLVSLLVLVLLVGSANARWSVYRKSNEMVLAMLSFEKHFDLWSCALVLNHSKKGMQQDGSFISPDNTLFIHFFQYLGSNKPVVFCDNYEGQSGLFPFKWKLETDPYLHLSSGNGVEGEPTGVDIEGYERKTKQKIDIVLTYGYEKWSNDSASLKTKSVLQENYQCVDSAASPMAIGLLKIYKRK